MEKFDQSYVYANHVRVYRQNWKGMRTKFGYTDVRRNGGSVKKESGDS